MSAKRARSVHRVVFLALLALSSFTTSNAFGAPVVSEPASPLPAGELGAPQALPFFAVAATATRASSRGRSMGPLGSRRGSRSTAAIVMHG